MIRLRSHALPAAILVIAACLAVLVLRDDPPATWLMVRAPASAQVDQPFVATVTLLEPEDGAYLDFDLHGQDSRRIPLRCVAASRSQAVSSDQHDYTFTLVVRDRPDLDRVHAIIYLSRTGQWSDQFRVARSKPFSLVRNHSGPSAAAASLQVYDQIPDPAIDVRNPPVARATISLVWFLGAAMAGTAWHRLPRPRPWPVVALAFLALAAWEAASAGAALSDFARAVAHGASLYEDRRPFQQAATAVFVVVFAVLMAVGLRRSRQRASGFAIAGVVLYATTILAGMLSLHEVDRMLAVAIGPWPLAVVLRLLAAGTSAAGVAGRLLRAR